MKTSGCLFILAGIQMPVAIVGEYFLPYSHGALVACSLLTALVFAFLGVATSE